MARCPALNNIELRHCHAITDVSAHAIAAGCPHLTALQMANVQNVTDAGLVAIAARCNSLRTMDISHTQAGDGTLSSLGRYNANLIALDISWCVNVTDTGVVAVARGCRGLRVFQFKGARKLTHEGIGAVAALCPRLSHIRMQEPLPGFSLPAPASRACRSARGLCDSWFSGCGLGGFC